MVAKTAKQSMISDIIRDKRMPPFGPKKFEVPRTDEEKALAEERAKLEETLYDRMKALATESVIVRWSPHISVLRSFEAVYKRQYDDQFTVAMIESDAGKDKSHLTIYTKEAGREDNDTSVRDVWLGQLSLSQIDEEVCMIDINDPERTWNDREAVELLRAGDDTITLMEQQNEESIKASAQFL
jgi:hypothetical protein